MSLSVSSQLQWSVDQTAGGAVSLMRSLVQAATSDNVQAMALDACERLGTTLPILNTATRIKIEQLAGRRHNQPLGFVKAQVGFCGGDSADMLAKTDGGLSFLCLAAILVSWGQGIQAAELLFNLVRQHAKNEQPLPTLLQFNDILKALKPKLADSGFTRDVVGCYDWCSRVVELDFNEEKGDKLYIASTPDSAGVQNLLDALNRCFRLGDDSCTLRIDSWTGFLPWVVAVTKWMLGDFPNVWLLDGSHFIKSSVPKISVFEATYGNDMLCKGNYGKFNKDISFKVTLSRRLNSLDQLISKNETSDAGIVAGMLDAQLWIKHRIAKLALPPGLCAQMLYFVAKYLAPKVLFRQTLEDVIQQAQGLDTEDILNSAFPDQDTRLAAMQHLLGDNIVLPEEDPDFVKLNDDITNSCVCKMCEARNKIRGSCSYSCVEDRLGQLATDLLSLTLFATEGQTHRFPLLSYSPWRTKRSVEGIDHIDGAVGRAQTWQDLIVYDWWPIMLKKLRFLSCNSHAIFEHALDLMGHTFESETFLSSANGQVVFPAILERETLRGSEYLQLRYTPGCLMWDGSILGALVSAGQSQFSRLTRPTSPTTKVGYSPEQSRVQSKIFSLTLGELQHRNFQYSIVSKALIPLGDDHFAVNVWDLIDGMSQAIFSPACDHRYDSPAGALAESFSYIWTHHEFGYHLGDQSLLIDRYGNFIQKVLALVLSAECCIIHRDGCIRCALALAKRLDVKIVIC